MSAYRSWRHSSGWSVEHCGHPTALWPYLLISPEGKPVVSFNGRGFTSMLAAQWAVKAIAAGMISIIDGCAQITATGKLVNHSTTERRKGNARVQDPQQIRPRL
jgi:hypothetical protein